MSSNRLDVTDQELFDYHLGVADPQTSRRVEDVLRSSSKAQAKLREFKAIEEAFQRVPLQNPSQQVLERVKQMARKEAKQSVWQQVQAFLTSQRLAWALMVFVVVGAGVTFNELKKQDPMNFSGEGSVAVQEGSSKELLGARKQELNAETDREQSKSNVTLGAGQGLQNAPRTLNDDLSKAQEFVNSGNVQAALALLQKLDLNSADLEQKRSALSLWVSALQMNEQPELAMQKQQELDALGVKP
ncbi:MAG: hypothetical protein H7A33_02945 [Deltaproteobacteria bacterium]|nr:hypothetical protein [Deltaproteobacteria bacterium]